MTPTLKRKLPPLDGMGQPIDPDGLYVCVLGYLAAGKHGDSAGQGRPGDRRRGSSVVLLASPESWVEEGSDPREWPSPRPT
jgi:hypothetical protein